MIMINKLFIRLFFHKMSNSRLLRAFLCLIFIGGGFGSAFADQLDDEKAYYARKIAEDPDPSVQGKGYEAIYWKLVNLGKEPLKAYRATYIYVYGYRLGFYYGATFKGQSPTDNYALFYNALQNYRNQEWSKDIWGWFEEGQLDGQWRGQRVGKGLEQPAPSPSPGQTPYPRPEEIGQYASSSSDDPNDPWNDLKYRQIQGPR